jgi:hypothetical protein
MRGKPPFCILRLVQRTFHNSDRWFEFRCVQFMGTVNHPYRVGQLEIRVTPSRRRLQPVFSAPPYAHIDSRHVGVFPAEHRHKLVFACPGFGCPDRADFSQANFLPAVLACGAGDRPRHVRHDCARSRGRIARLRYRPAHDDIIRARAQGVARACSACLIVA